MSFSFDRPATCGLGYPVSLRHATLVFGRASAVHLSWWKSTTPRRLPSRGVPQLVATLADRDARPPIRAVVGTRRSAGLPLLHLHRLHRRNTFVVLGEPHTPGRDRDRPARCGTRPHWPPSPTYARRHRGFPARRLPDCSLRPQAPSDKPSLTASTVLAEIPPPRGLL